MLSVKFKQETGTDLSKKALRFLAIKACRVYGNISDADIDILSLTWEQFAKEHLSNSHFTFWQWFYDIMKLIKNHFAELWTDGTIIGFIDKASVEQALQFSPIGTFLLRFSESALACTDMGGISICYVKDRTKIEMLRPWSINDLRSIRLANRICDLKDSVTSRILLTHLWTPTGPVPKEDIFLRHYSASNRSAPRSGGYTPSVIVPVV